MSADGKRVFSHEDAFAELGALALGALSAVEMDAIVEHVSQCSICSAELAVMYDTATSLAAAGQGSAPGMAPARSAAIRAELVERARLDGATRQLAGVKDSPVVAPVVDDIAVARGRQIAREKRFSFAPMFAVALAASVMLAVLTLRKSQEAKALQQLSAQLNIRIDSLESELGVSNRMITQLAGKTVKVVELTAAGITAPSARMFWDVATDKWTLFAHDLPALASGKTYQLWLVTAGGKVSAGTFAPSATGFALVQADYALNPADLQAIAVTEEPAGGVPQPTGPIVIAGTPSK